MRGYEMRISDWCSDVCSSDLPDRLLQLRRHHQRLRLPKIEARGEAHCLMCGAGPLGKAEPKTHSENPSPRYSRRTLVTARTEEHTSEPQSLMPTSYAGLRLTNKNK